MPPTAVAFDLDYTLAVPDRDRATLLSEATDRAGAPPLTREAYLDAHADNLTERTREPIFEALLAGRESDATAAEVARAYRELVTESLVSVPGVESLLETLRAEYRLGLLTNGPVVAQRHKLTHLGWEAAFDAALVTGSLPAGKPDAAAFDALLDALGTHAGETVYVGDDVTADVGGAAAAGLVPVQVTFEGGPDPDPRAVAHVPRDELATRLPELVTEMALTPQ